VIQNCVGAEFRVAPLWLEDRGRAEDIEQAASRVVGCGAETALLTGPAPELYFGPGTHLLPGLRLEDLSPGGAGVEVVAWTDACSLHLRVGPGQRPAAGGHRVEGSCIGEQVGA